MSSATRATDARPLACLSRRKFLYAALGVGSSLTATGVVGGLWVRGPVPSVAGLRVLSAFEFRVVSDIVSATFPAAGPIPLDARELELPRVFDGFVADLPAEQQTDLRRALLLVEIAPLIWDGKRTTFTRLSPEDRAAYWENWAASDRLLQRQISLTFRKFLNMLFYDWFEVWSHIGYPGPSLARLSGAPQ